LIQVYSCWSASTSVPTVIQSTAAAVVTICWVRACSVHGSAKYELSRLRRLFAFPT
jgi:hypothetical protein